MVVYAYAYKPIISVVRRLRQEDSEFQISLVNTMRPCLKK